MAKIDTADQQANFGQSSLTLRATSCYYPHPDKVDYGGEDAHFISVHGAGAIGVADGVGGWRKQGVNPADYARTFMHNSCCWLERRLDDLLEAPEREFQQPNLVAAYGSQAQTDALASLVVAHNITRVHGSSTACVMQLDGRSGCLTAANVGDSGFVVVRGKQVIAHSMVLQHHFDCPLQLGHPDLITVTDWPEDADMYTIPVEPGDIVIMGTDGLWDNVFVEEILQLLPSSMDDLDAAAQRVAELAVSHAGDPRFRSPYSIEANKASRSQLKWWQRLLGSCCSARGHHGMCGGKMDDITAIVAMVTAGEGSSTPDGIVRLPAAPAAAGEEAKKRLHPEILVLQESSGVSQLHELPSMPSSQPEMVASSESNIVSGPHSIDRGVLFTHTHSNRTMEPVSSIGGDSEAEQPSDWRRAPRAESNGVPGVLRGGQSANEARPMATTWEAEEGDVVGSGTAPIPEKHLEPVPRTPNRPLLDPVSRRYFETPATPSIPTIHNSPDAEVSRPVGRYAHTNVLANDLQRSSAAASMPVPHQLLHQRLEHVVVKDLEGDEPAASSQPEPPALVSHMSAPAGLRLSASEADLLAHRAPSVHSDGHGHVTTSHLPPPPRRANIERPSSAWLMDDPRQGPPSSSNNLAMAAGGKAASSSMGNLAAAAGKAPSKSSSSSSSKSSGPLAGLYHPLPDPTSDSDLHHSLGRRASLKAAAPRMGGFRSSRSNLVDLLASDQSPPAPLFTHQNSVHHADGRPPAEPVFVVSDFEQAGVSPVIVADGSAAGNGQGLPGAVHGSVAGRLFEGLTHNSPSKIPGPPKYVVRHGR